MFITNTPTGWRLFADNFMNTASVSQETKQALPPMQMEVRISEPLTTAQLQNLQYCLMECDRIESILHHQCQKTLSIYVLTNEDAYRILHYFYMVQQLRAKTFLLKVFADGILVDKLPQKLEHVRFGRILPLLCIGTSQDNPSIISYYDVISSTLPEYLIEQYRRVMAGHGQRCPYESDAQVLLSDYYLHRIKKAYMILSGTNSHRLSSQRKDELIQELEALLLRELPDLGLLSRTIWACSLWILACSKALLRLNPREEWILDKEAIQTARLNAITYAEGLQQLLENACIHSNVRRAYLSIRIHYTDIVSHHAVKRAWATREALHEKIAQISRMSAGKGNSSAYRLASNAKYYFEFQVINDSVGIKTLPNHQRQELAPRGIAQTYYEKNTHNRHSKRPYTLKQIFAQKFHTADDAVQHYGLRILEKTVRLNGGYFCVTSPGLITSKPPCVDIYQAFSGIPQKAQTLNTSQQSFERYTHFYILLPAATHKDQFDTPPSITRVKNSLSPKQFCPLFSPCGLNLPYRQKIIQFQVSPSSTGPHYRFCASERLLSPFDASEEPHFQQAVSVSRKRDIIQNLTQDLDEVAPQSAHTIYLLDLTKVQSSLTAEVVAKSLFLAIAQKGENRSQQEPQETADTPSTLYALLFPAKAYCWEFIRLFSIFYDRLNSTTWMQRTQIALCGYPIEVPGTPPLPEVQFLLAGATSSSAWETARTFAYYNGGETMEMVSQLQYLTQNDSEHVGEPGVAQFPFDLYLNASPLPEPSAKSWFLQKMDRHLQSDLWRRGLGCRLHGIRFRLRSNICLTDFYEAELLFHNVGITYRFAYLIAQDILRQLQLQPSDHPLILVGYELYSSVLTQQIVKLLREQLPQKKVYYLICSGQAVPGEPLHRSPELQRMEKKQVDDLLRDAAYISVIPIGTTLSTLYHLQRTVVKEAGTGPHPLQNFEHYVLILVGAEEEELDLSREYWRKDNHTNIVTLTPQAQNTPALRCRVYLEPRTHWQERTLVSEKASCHENVLVYVDQTATLPKDIFIGEDSHFRGISSFLQKGSDQSENLRRISLLKNCIHYGHITAGNNHFQFYLDMDRYFAQASISRKRPKSITAWLDTLRNSVDVNAYNIIVSPLHQEDAPFAKAVLDHVFEHSFHFLHVDFARAFREDIRSKFSYIAEEYRQIRTYDYAKPVHVYFVNTAITSGTTLLRARNLMMMLLEEAVIPYDRNSVFKGCFVMVNRSGFDTLNSYVSDPMKNFHAYVHLAVPTFNVDRDRCPTCELVEKYRTIEERCATEQLRREFHRLAGKHARREFPQYIHWLRGTIMTSCGYANWLRQWLFSYVLPATHSERPIMLGVFSGISQLELDCLKQLATLLDWALSVFLDEHRVSLSQPETYLQILNSFSLRELDRLCCNYPKDAENALGPNGDLNCLKASFWQQVVLDYVCGQKNYLRLQATHSSFIKMEACAPTELASLPLEKRGEKTADILIDLINSALKSVSSLDLRVEWLISYLKVLSRPHLAQYHHIRQGSLTLLLRMIEFALQETDETNCPQFFSYLSLTSTVHPTLQYQLIVTILKRLSGLQSTYLLQKEHINAILIYMDALRQKYFALFPDESRQAQYMRFQPFPPEEEIRLTLTKLIKWSSSCGDDENGCFLIEDEFSGGTL